MVATIGSAVPSVKRPTSGDHQRAGHQLQRADQRRRRAGDGAVRLERQHRRGRDHQAEEGEADEEQRDQHLEPVAAGEVAARAAAPSPPRSRWRRCGPPRSRPKRAPSLPVNCEAPMKPSALTEKARLYCGGVRPKWSISTNDELARKAEEARHAEAADEGQAEEVAVAQQQRVAGERAAQAAVDALVRRPGFRRARWPPARCRPAPATVTAQNTPRQPTASITRCRPAAPGSATTLNTSISSAISRAASTPVCRSRTMARGIAMPAHAPRPCTKRNAISDSMLGASAQPTLASDEERQAEVERRLAADHVGDRPVEELAERRAR